MPKTSAPKRRPVSLALQGGGSHGAFQWGVLDRLLEDDRLDIRAVTAASAGAMNAAALITGLAKDGAEGARAQLDLLWREVNQAGGRNVFGASAGAAPSWLKDSAAWRAGETLALSLSPYQFNPFNLNPLKRVIANAVDFEAVRSSDIALFVSTTAVRQGRARVFKTPEMTADVLLASGCLPHLFQAVEIEGEPYWDGGYLANPALWPLFYADTPDDILMLPLNPFARDQVPRAADEIADRLNEIVFNAPLVAELRAVAFVQELIEAGTLKQVGKDRYRRLLMHAVEPGLWLGGLPLSSKFDTEWSFLNDLKARGREAGEQWLDTCFDAVGERSSVDVRERFL
ncbi:MAG: patatin-like phospholipase family protein [Brevundimonas sp.]|uniref:patatin-like phospholipase family protein n=1 Tax=Brevundimonas sp. TaxID=1871086 RepID=UPI001A320400|nr:patatin-like phospholipase family protein [Brevundimonas sp.]MBJ7445896.1 patatin-like phospholipase family protein [Brevundimonas sp.]